MPERLQRYVNTVHTILADWKYVLWNADNIHTLDVPYSSVHRLDYSIAADIIRLAAIYRQGGIYLDTDVEVLRPLNKLLDYEAFAAKQHDNLICNAVFGAEPEHPWVFAQLAQADVLRAREPAHSVHLMSATPVTGRPLTLIPSEWVYSWAYDAPAEKQIVHPDALAVHHWEASWLRH